jgi:hypothetical protein
MRYFFNIVRAGISIRDLEGADFDTDRNAEQEAILIARELIGRQLISGGSIDWASWLEVQREDNTVVAAVSFLQAAQVPQPD